jgi:hypothetical protein
MGSDKQRTIVRLLDGIARISLLTFLAGLFGSCIAAGIFVSLPAVRNDVAVCIFAASTILLVIVPGTLHMVSLFARDAIRWSASGWQVSLRTLLMLTAFIALIVGIGSALYRIH